MIFETCKRKYHSLLHKVRPYLGVRANWNFLSNSFAWDSALSSAAGGKKILIATSTGGNWPCSSFESLLGVALTLRGADVSYLLCDGVLSACQQCTTRWLPEDNLIAFGPQKDLCESCFSPALRMLEPLGLKIYRYGDLLRKNESINKSEASGINLAHHARAGALRYYGRGELRNTQAAQNVYDSFSNAAKQTYTALTNLLEEYTPDTAVFHHGIYVPQGILGDVFKKADIDIVTWGISQRKRTVLFSHGDTYHHTMPEEPSDQWNDLDWSIEMDEKLMMYLESRKQGKNEWINYQPKNNSSENDLFEELKFDRRKPIIGLLTNVLWDAQLHFKRNAFPNMLSWIEETIRYFLGRDDLQLLIRVHPGESVGVVPSTQKVEDEIFRIFGNLPDRIKIVGPDHKVSTYSLMNLCDSALTYATKTSLELACIGIPVIVAGDAWCRGKGFTIDADSPANYVRLLDRLPLSERLTRDQVMDARKYAYHFYFRRMIEVRSLRDIRRFAPFKVCVDSLDDIQLGVDEGLDIICEGIMKGTNFKKT